MVIPADRFAVYQTSGLENVLEVRTPHTGFGGTNCNASGIPRTKSSTPASTTVDSKLISCTHFVILSYPVRLAGVTLDSTQTRTMVSSTRRAIAVRLLAPGFRRRPRKY